MKLLSFVALTDGAPFDVLPDEACGVGVVEGRAEPMQRLLNAFMSGAVDRGQQLGPDRRRGRHEDAAVVEEAVYEGPSRRRCALSNLVLLFGNLWHVLRLAAEFIVEVERRRGEVGGALHVLIAPG
jgi:hypothetical protein